MYLIKFPGDCEVAPPAVPLAAGEGRNRPYPQPGAVSRQPCAVARTWCHTPPGAPAHARLPGHAKGNRQGTDCPFIMHCRLGTRKRD